MSVRIELTWDGEKAFQDYLSKTIPDAFEASLTDALQSSAQDGKDRAQQLVPIDTGALRASIRVERLAKEARNISYTGIRAGGYVRNPKTNKLVDYASYVEYGTSRQMPQPYMRPAAEYAMKRFKDYFWAELSKRVEKY